MTLLLPPVGPLVAARTYLVDELAARDNPLHVGVTPPPGTPESYALLSRPGGSTREFLGDYMIRLRVFDADAVRLETNADLLHRLLVTVNHRKITTPLGDVWVTGARPQYGPASFEDSDVPLFGFQAAVFWTLGLHPEPAGIPPAEPPAEPPADN